MTIQFTTFVAQTTRLGFDYDTPTLVVHTDLDREIEHLPFVEQLLREADDQVTPIARGYSPLANHRHSTEPRDHRLAPVPVSAQWQHVMRAQYDHRAKVIMVLQPVTSTGTLAGDVPATGAAPGVSLPSWLDLLFTSGVPIATRDVPVQTEFMMTIAAWPHIFSSVEEWAGEGN